ncbi:MAG: D-psicose 3-epimerase [Verrucomicrobia subdivision 3 bacterium]|nr:D-psicose 3-epimerase [Limisphaerales bacterium]MCS1416854.1 D-psicose 3-epimerase [Limisphaerales bacterium]
MIKTAITVSLVEQACGGPFVLWDGIEKGCQTAASLGFDAIELFAPSPNKVPADTLKPLLEANNIEIAAVGTGAGMVIHGLTLCDPDSLKRDQAKDFITDMIHYGAQFGVPAIIGSMQGHWGGNVSRDQAFEWLRAALNDLGEIAGNEGVPLIYEPLNRYETNLCNTIAQGVDLCQSLSTQHVKLLADVFHMGIEEADPADAMASGKGYIGHVHFVDSNRQAAGRGHLNLEAIAKALIKTGYDRFISAECFPIPDSESAAKDTTNEYKRLFPR